MTPDQFGKIFNELTAAANKSELYIAAPMKSIFDLFKKRIFKEGKNTDGEQIGKYRKYYSKKYRDFWKNVRSKRGKQIAYVDLDFTGGIKKSIVLSKSKNGSEFSIIFSNKKKMEIADFQEHLQGWKNGNPSKKRLGKGASKSNFSEVYSTTPMDIFSISDNEYRKIAGLFDSSFDIRIEKVLSKYT